MSASNLIISAPKPFKILIVDDERAQRQLLIRWVRQTFFPAKTLTAPLFMTPAMTPAMTPSVTSSAITATTSLYQITEADNGAEALEIYQKALVEEDPFHLVFSDHQMPGELSGKDFLTAALRVLDRELPLKTTLVFRTSVPQTDFADSESFFKEVLYINKMTGDNPKEVKEIIQKAYEKHQHALSIALDESDPHSSLTLTLEESSRRRSASKISPLDIGMPEQKMPEDRFSSPSTELSSTTTSKGESKENSGTPEKDTHTHTPIKRKKICCCWFSTSLEPTSKPSSGGTKGAQMTSPVPQSS